MLAHDLVQVHVYAVFNGCCYGCASRISDMIRICRELLCDACGLCDCVSHHLPVHSVYTLHAPSHQHGWLHVNQRLFELSLLYTETHI